MCPDGGEPGSRQECCDGLGDPPTRPATSGFQIDQGAFIEPHGGGKLHLSQPSAAPGGAQACGEALAGRFRVAAEVPHDPAVVPSERPGAPGLPEPDCLRPHPEGGSEGSLRLVQVEPAATDMVAEGVEYSRITPWQAGRSWSPEPQAGKRQRNGARAGGSGTRSEAAAARRRTSRATPLASAVRSSTGSTCKSKSPRSPPTS